MNYTNRNFTWDFDSLKRFYERYVVKWLNNNESWTEAQKKQARANLGLGNGDIDSEPTAGSNNLITSGAVNNAINSKASQSDLTTLNGKVSALETSVGLGGVDSRIAAAKTEIKGTATSACDTLGEAEAKINANTTAISNEVTRAEAAEEALDGRIDTLEDVVGSEGSIDSRISAAVATETTRAQGAESTLQGIISTETERAQGAETALDGRIDTLEETVLNVAYLEENDGSAVVADFDPQSDTVWRKAQILSADDKAQVQQNIGVYGKEETYTKTEVNGLVDTPHQEYVTVDAYADLPATGSKDTIYRVSNYNGSTSLVDTSVYSEYAWDGSQYIFLCVKSQIGEVFDISVYNNNAVYANLSAALGANGANVPESLRKGGMSVKFVQSNDNKYVQFRYMGTSTATADFTNVDNWQGVDEEPTVGSENLVKSGGVKKAISALENIRNIEEDKFTIIDNAGNIGLQYGINGLDAEKVSPHLKGLVVNDEHDRALTAEEALTSSISNIENDIEILENIRNIEEDKFAIADNTGNVAMEVDENGNIDANGFGPNLTNEISKLVGGIDDGSYRKAYSELLRVKDEMSYAIDSIVAVKETNGNNYSGTITIPMSSASEDIKHGVFRLGLHYGNHLGSNIWHEVFFGGNVKKDFSDVRIKDASGKILPTRLIHSGNYEVVQDYKIMGSGEYVPFKDGKVYFNYGRKIYYTDDDWQTKTILPNQVNNVNNFHIDSKGGIWFTDYDTHKVYVCYPSAGQYNFNNQIEICDLKITNGQNNTVDGNLRILHLAEDNAGYVYLAVYQENFNPVIFRTINPLSSSGVVADGSGNYVFECYHQTIVYKDGTDNIDPNYVDQHVHNLTVFIAKDSNGNDVCNIIAGLDNSLTSKGPNLISSIDHGQTWVSFRDTINDIDWSEYRGHDYSFTWMSENNDYTILCGESNVLGSPTITKMYTQVDANGRIIPTGKLGFEVCTYNAIRMAISDGDDWIMTALTSIYQNNYASIVVSEDNAKTWNSIYTDYREVQQGVGGGCRRFSKKIKQTNSESNDPCWYALGYTTAENNLPPVRIYKGGEHYYGELLVDVGALEAGTDVVLTVESGYLSAAPNKQLFNRHEVVPVWELSLDEGEGNVVVDSLGVKHQITGEYEWGKLDNPTPYYRSLPIIRDYNEGGGLSLKIGATISLGKVDVLKFNKNFSIIYWMSYRSDAGKSIYDSNWKESNEYYYMFFPVINSDSFAIGQQNNGFRVGGKSNNTYTRGYCPIPRIKRVFQPVMITVSNDDIPVITSYIGDDAGAAQNNITATSWPSQNLCDLLLSVGSNNTVIESYGEINKPVYIRGIALYDKVLTQDEFRSIIHGRSITSDYDIINK